MKHTKPFIGIDLGGTNIQLGLLDSDNKIIARHRTKTRADEGSKSVLSRISGAVTELLETAGLSRHDVGGVGIGAPGATDINKGLVFYAPNLRWNKFPLAEKLGAELRMRVTVDNDVNVATWGECVVGQKNRYPDMLGVWVGTGIGGGLVLGGKLYYGAYQTAGEVGHVILQGDAPLGRRTLENLASRTAMINQLVQLIRANHASRISDMVGGDLEQVRSKIVARALAEDDALTKAVVKQGAKYVGQAIANVVTVMSLPCAVVGGGFTAAVGKRYVDWVRESFEASVFPAELQSCKILMSELGDDSGHVGAALLARERLSR
jgi:glucokinase